MCQHIPKTNERNHDFLEKKFFYVAEQPLFLSLQISLPLLGRGRVDYLREILFPFEILTTRRQMLSLLFISLPDYLFY